MALATVESTVEELQAEMAQLEQDFLIEGLSDQAKEIIRRRINKCKKWIKKQAVAQ